MFLFLTLNIKQLKIQSLINTHEQRFIFQKCLYVLCLPGYELITVLKIILLQLPLYIGFTGMMIFIGILFKSNMATTLFTILYQFMMIFISAIATSIHLSEIDPVTCLDHLAYLNNLSTSIIYKTEFVGFIFILISLTLGIYVFCYRDIA